MFLRACFVYGRTQIALSNFPQSPKLSAASQTIYGGKRKLGVMAEKM